MDAVERLNRFKEESKIRERKHELYSGTNIQILNGMKRRAYHE